MVVTSGENDYPGVRSGINMVIKIDGQRQGVVGITGAPEEVMQECCMLRFPN